MAEERRGRIPRGLELAWNTDRERARAPGPRPALGLQRIVRAAIEIADRGGLGAVSLARVASELSVATTALYRYVRTKEDLVLLMRDTAAAPPPALAMPDPDHWRPALRDIAREIFRLHRRHPWVLQVPTAGPPTTPNELLWGEHMLRAMSRTGLDYPDQLRAVTLIFGYAREQARLALDPAVDNDDASTYFAFLGSVLRPDRYPMFCRVLADDTVTTSIGLSEEDFEFGLDRILSGLAELVDAAG